MNRYCCQRYEPLRRFASYLRMNERTAASCMHSTGIPMVLHGTPRVLERQRRCPQFPGEGLGLCGVLERYSTTRHGTGPSLREASSAEGGFSAHDAMAAACHLAALFCADAAKPPVLRESACKRKKPGLARPGWRPNKQTNKQTDRAKDKPAGATAQRAPPGCARKGCRQPAAAARLQRRVAELAVVDAADGRDKRRRRAELLLHLRPAAPRRAMLRAGCGMSGQRAPTTSRVACTVWCTTSAEASAIFAARAGAKESALNSGRR